MSIMSLGARSCRGHHFSAREIRTKVQEWLTLYLQYNEHQSDLKNRKTSVNLFCSFINSWTKTTFHQFFNDTYLMSSRKYYYRRPTCLIGDLDMPRRRPTCLIGDLDMPHRFHFRKKMKFYIQFCLALLFWPILKKMFVLQRPCLPLRYGPQIFHIFFTTIYGFTCLFHFRF